MDWQAILTPIFSALLIAILGVLTKFIVSFLDSKTAQMQANTKDELLSKYLGILNDTIQNCVIATNQTYVEALKKDNAFTEEAQKMAFAKTYQAVIASLSEDAKNILPEAVGDLQTYITSKIEANVKLNKNV